jgi:hypothetical protein
MKRSEALKLIANQLDFLNGSFSGVRTNFTESEIKNADVILTTLEHAGMVARYTNSYGFLNENNEVIMNDGWEPEDE